MFVVIMLNCGMPGVVIINGAMLSDVKLNDNIPSVLMLCDIYAKCCYSTCLAPFILITPMLLL